MTGDLPAYYFRVRENGASVFRVDSENRARRIDFDEIATVNIRNGVIKAQGSKLLSDQDIAAIREWMVKRVADLAARDLDDIVRTVDHLNLTTHWAATKASEAELVAVTDRLLLAMHDLRQVLVRRKAARLAESADEG